MMNQPKRKRRFFSFSLRSLMIVMLLLCCLFAWIGMRHQRALEQRAILDKIKASGVVVYLGRKKICRPTDRELFFDGNYISRIERADYPFVFKQGGFAQAIKHWGGQDIPKSPDIDLSPLAKFKNLQILDLSFSQVSDLSPLTDLKNLKQLSLDYTNITDLTPLAELKNLEKLFLNGTGVTDLAPLFGLKNLIEVSVRNKKLDDREIDNLRNALPNCIIN